MGKKRPGAEVTPIQRGPPGPSEVSGRSRFKPGWTRVPGTGYLPSGDRSMSQTPEVPPETALVTGASGGIGESFAKLLAAKNYGLILVARNRARLEALSGSLGGRPSSPVETLPLDLSLPGSPEEVLKFAES